MPDEIDHLTEPTPEAAKLSRFDMRSLWRVVFWGSSAALAVVVVAGTALSDVGTQRFHVVLASALDHLRPTPPTPPAPSEPPPVMVSRAAEIEKQTQELGRQTQEFRRQTQELNAQAQQLRETVKQLSADRDQLKIRISLLEQNLEDITGAIKRQAQQPPSASKEPTATATHSPPAIAAPPTATASITETPPRASTSSPATEQAAVPVPPMRTAALPTAQPTEKREFGVDLGGAKSLEHLRIAWATIKANAGPELTGMRPTYAQRPRADGTIEYRLVVVGSFQDTTEAAVLCSRLTAVKLNCRPGHYRVSQLAER
jgi:TolA-binding protein